MNKEERLTLNRTAESLRSAANSIAIGFTWAESPEGFDYWSSWDDALLALSRTLESRASDG